MYRILYEVPRNGVLMRFVWLIIIASVLVLLPWISGLDLSIDNQIVVDGMYPSAIIVLSTTIFLSIFSWVLFSWASKSIKFTGFLLSIITGASLVLPFYHILGPMAGIILGVVAGSIAFLLHQKMIRPTQNKSMIGGFAIITLAYFILIVMVLTVQSASHTWDTGDGIGAWTGTAEGIEKTGFDNVLGNNISFDFFLVIIPSLIITGFIIQDKKNLKIRILLVFGIALMIEGLLATIYTSFVLFPPTEPPMMRSLQGIDYVFFIHREIFLVIGILGFFVTLVGIIMWRKRK